MPESKTFRFSFDEPNEKASLFVDEDEYRIHYDLEAIETFYLIFNVNPVLQGVGLDPVKLAILLWVGLLKFQPAVESDLVKSWFTVKAMETLILGTGRAWKMSLPDAPKETPPPDPPIA